jgi:hypothetical protein
MGDTPVGEAVGRGMMEVCLSTSSNASTIMMAVMDNEGAGIDSSPESWEGGEGKLADEVIKAETARQLFDARNAARAVTCAQLRQELYKAGSHDVIGPRSPSRHACRGAIDWLTRHNSGANLVQAPANNLQQRSTTTTRSNSTCIYVGTYP